MLYEIKKILVPIDFSETANNALHVAIAMANRHKAEIHLVHIVEPEFYTTGINYPDTPNGTMEDLLNQAAENIKKHKTALQKNNSLVVHTHVESGIVSNCVSKYGAEQMVDILVMGTHGLNGWNEYFLGSNAMAIIKECECPVITIPPAFKKRTFDSILYPIKNVDGVLEKYDCIKPIIEKNDAQIHLLGVAKQNDHYEIGILNNKLRAVREAIQHNNEYISYETYKSNNIAKKILEVAHKRNDDILIINATLDKNWYRYFCGTITLQILNHSKIPVLSIKPVLSNELEKSRKAFLTEAASHYSSLFN